MRAGSRATSWRWGSPRAPDDPAQGVAARGATTARASQRRVISRREGLCFRGGTVGGPLRDGLTVGTGGRQEHREVPRREGCGAPGSRAVARVCLGEVRLGKWTDRGCAGSFAREAEYSKGYWHFANIITLAKCGTAVKAELGAPQVRALGHDGLYRGRKQLIGVGKLPAPMARFLPQCAGGLPRWPVSCPNARAACSDETLSPPSTGAQATVAMQRSAEDWLPAVLPTAEGCERLPVCTGARWRASVSTGARPPFPLGSAHGFP